MQATKFLLKILLKRNKQAQPTEGFTLIEILVALVIALLVIAPLLGLAVNLLDTDRKEQAKATSEQEIQAASDFIARDVQQAVFIYDRTGLDKIKDQIPPNAGADGCRDTALCQPVLVFWKRKPYKDAVPIDSQKGTSAIDCTNDANANQCDDAFVYSLVGYYYILPNANETTWSKTSRIGRFEITDGVKYMDNFTLIETKQSNASKKKIDKGFAPFKINPGQDIAAAMNEWKKSADAYTVQTQTLIDYIDPTPTSVTDAKRQDCPNKGASDEWTQTPINTERSGFYACINPSDDTARVYIRGNSLARYRSGSPQYNKNIASQFPSASFDARGVGKLRQ